MPRFSIRNHDSLAHVRNPSKTLGSYQANIPVGPCKPRKPHAARDDRKRKAWAAGTEMRNGPVFQVRFSGLQPMVETGPGYLDLSASWLAACWTGACLHFVASMFGVRAKSGSSCRCGTRGDRVWRTSNNVAPAVCVLSDGK